MVFQNIFYEIISAMLGNVFSIVMVYLCKWFGFNTSEYKPKSAKFYRQLITLDILYFQRYNPVVVCYYFIIYRLTLVLSQLYKLLQGFYKQIDVGCFVWDIDQLYNY